MDDPHRILVVSDDTAYRWTDLWEGPWETAAEAIAFARAEVGVPWVVVDACDSPVAFGDYDGKRGGI